MKNSLPVLRVAAVALAGCKAKTPAPAAKEAPAAEKPAPAPEKEPPLHTSNPAVEHAKPRAEPPPTAQRAATAETVDGAHSQLIVSDVAVASGASATAIIEVRPKDDWKINTEYPIKVTLSGAVSSVPPRLVFKKTDPEPNPIQQTNGGIRVDIPLSGDAPGEDQLTATVKFGVCSKDACLLEKEQATWRVEVTAP